MVEKQQLISPDFVIHPGETILEIIQDRGISQKELAKRTGFSEKHISTVINGKKNISAEFAKKLSFALDVPASFWLNLQNNYDLEVLSFIEAHNISQIEIEIGKEVQNAVEIIRNETIEFKNESDLVYNLRHILGVSNLEAIHSLNVPYYRAQFEYNTSENIMYTWQYLCEKSVENQTNNPLDIDKLRKSIPKIKKVMHLDYENHIDELQKILNECGVLFTVKKHVKKAPIKGLTVKTKKNQVMIAMTIRGAYVDIFWFTLFHEIAHVINQDYLKNQEEWKSDNPIEIRADKFAADALIDPKLYSDFVREGKFTEGPVLAFAKKADVLPTIVIGRLMNDKHIKWSTNEFYRSKYNWHQF